MFALVAWSCRVYQTGSSLALSRPVSAASSVRADRVTNAELGRMFVNSIDDDAAAEGIDNDAELARYLAL